MLMHQHERLLLNEREAAALLGVCVRTMLDLRKRGALTPIRIGKRGLRYAVDDLREFVRAARAEHAGASMS